VKLYGYLLTCFCVLLFLSNVAATKLIEIGPLIFDCGALLFPLTYIFSDIFAEIYGFKKARLAVFFSFVIQLFACLVLLVVQILPPSSAWPNQAAFEAILGFVPRIVIASLLAYLIGQLLNAYLLVQIKKKTGEPHLWVRLLGSTIIGEAADSIIFCTIAWFGLINLPDFAIYVSTGFAYKTLVEVILLPLTYRVINRLKKSVSVSENLAEI
jgi:uncharacterized integral membrane protein (TIGR00697 family)